MNKKILFITLSNIGDAILTLPVLDRLKDAFLELQVTCIAAPRTKEIFENNPNISRFIIYNKHSRLREKIKLLNELRREHFDIIVDLRNSLFQLFLPAKHKTSFFLNVPKNIKHMKNRHLYRLSSLRVSTLNSPEAGEMQKTKRGFLYSSAEDKEYINNLLRQAGVSDDDLLIAVASGARSHTKRWPQEKFVELIRRIQIETGAKVVLLGDKNDTPINKYINTSLGNCLLDFTGKTTLSQLAYLLKKTRLIISNDSAVMHMASYLDVASLAIFGPTDEKKYGPWSSRSCVAKKDIFCRPCQKAQCRFKTLDCLYLIKVEDVLGKIKILLSQDPKQLVPSKEGLPKRILIVRTDRIGDVLLSTPVIKAVRDKYPDAFIAMMVSPYSKDIVNGNPYLDQVITYDKDAEHKGWISSMKFAFWLKKKKFDLAIILHPTNRVHLVTFLSGIPKRIGYDRKLSFLLSDKIKHTKQLGEKHELEYSLDFLKYLNIQITDKALFMPIKPESERQVEELLSKEGVSRDDLLIAINPGASCPSKIWPYERFAVVADELIEKYGFKILIISGPKDVQLVDKVTKTMRNKAINLGGKTSISQLASILKRCKLFISNDSGPVHLASALGVPVAVIFGRNQKGLSPKRWGPLGKNNQVLHKEVGCIICLAHNCKKEFECLKSITTNEVLKAANLILETKF